MEPNSASQAEVHSPPVEEAIRQRAREIYEKSGRVPGRDEQNWRQAESEVLQEFATRSRSRVAYVIIRLKGVTYTGEYDPQATNYRAGELAAGPVKVKLSDGRMVITRPNGALLETRVVKCQPAQ